MKKIVNLLILFIILVPVIAKAEVGSATQVGIFTEKSECLAEIELNDKTANQQATAGYYLTCVEISCVDSKTEYKDFAPMLENIVCSNGNKNPFVASRQSGIAEHSGLEEGATCSIEETEEEEAFETTYTTVKFQYNCDKTKTGESYGIPKTSSNTQASSNIQTSSNTTTAKTEESIKSPATGINTYYLVLTILVVFLSAGLYIVNKKNLFKKI